MFYKCYSIAYFSAVILITTVETAQAYIDPGSGSLLLQMIISVIVGGLFYFRKFLTSFLSIFKKRDDQGQNHPNE